MKKSDIAKVYLEIAFGSDPKTSLKAFINLALDQGEYYEGFETAISKNDLDYKEYDELYAAFMSAYKDEVPDIEAIKLVIEKHLPQSYFTSTSWLVSEAGEIYATDGLRVAKIFDNKLIWVTKRISWDGINLEALIDSEVVGQWYSPIDENSPWSELRISTTDGSLLKGEIIEY